MYILIIDREKRRSPVNLGAKKLTSWLTLTKTGRSEFARTLGRVPSKVSQVANGLEIPTMTLAFDIEKSTKGFVKMQDWVSGEGDEDYSAELRTSATLFEAEALVNKLSKLFS
jgi:hypothetical protein